ncbi:MAG: hypothetical protein IH586_22560 [Anaerolineaceae bacterium]|nr:hypothetical protein [Anaerolineaceae bacterium]
MSNRQSIASICEQVYRRFPEVAGKQPRVQSQSGDQLLLIFHGSAKTADGRSIPRIIRVVVSPDGKIVKMTTSR